MAYVLAGGRGSRLMELTDTARQARGLFRRQVAHHRLRAVQCAQFRHPPHRRRHAVQGAQPDPPSAARLELLPPERNESFDILPASQRVSEEQWYARHGRRRLSEHRHHRELRARNTSCILAGDHIYKMDYEPMLQQHVEQDADVTVGCSRCRAPRRPASAYACRRERPHHRPSSRSRRIRRRCPARPDRRSPAWASTSSRRKFLIEQLRRDAADPHSSHDFGKDIIPYIVKNGKAVAHHFSRLLRALAARSRALLARRRHGRRLLGGQYRPHRHRARSSISTTATGRSGPIAEITPPAKFVHDEDGRRGRRSPRWSRAAASSPAPSLRRSLLFTGVRINSYRDVENAVVLPYVDIGRTARLTQCRRRSRRHDPRRARRRRGSRARRRALPPHREGHLPDHPADDRQARCGPPR